MMSAEDRVSIILGRAIIRAEALRIDEVRERITAKLRSAPNDAHYMQVVVGLHDLAALLDDHARLSKMRTDDR